jgi:UDP-GlcNAc3NAcA epimerase
MKIVTVIGARPQFVKAAAVSRVFRDYPQLTEVIIHTGQHFDANMSDVFFEELDIPKPDYHLGIGGGTHGENTGRMIEKIEGVLLKEQPDWVMVYGDTDSTLAASIAAKKLHIFLAHVEAGLRSFNMKMPEEINRIVTDRISNTLFCPTITAVNNLEKEGFNSFDLSILNVGDVMLDASLYYQSAAKKNLNVKDIKPGSFCLCTIHRADNTADVNSLYNIINALREISKHYTVILPIHPRTAKKIRDSGLDFSGDRILLIDPVGYLEMIWFLDNCSFVITDSGGLQKEAYFFNKICITLRNETEWTELVEAGVNFLVGSNYDLILEAFKNLPLFKQKQNHLYGNGNAAKKIADFFINQKIN